MLASCTGLSSALTVRRLRVDRAASGEPLPALWFDARVELGERRRTSIPRPHRPVDHDSISRTIVRAVGDRADRSLEEIAADVADALLLQSDAIAAVEIVIETDARLDADAPAEAFGAVVRRVRADLRKSQSVSIPKSPRLLGP